MAVSGYTSAEPLVALLKEDDSELKGLALETLDEHIHEFWSELAPNVSYIEELSEDPSFEHYQLAAMVASKLYYHLGAFDDALRCALNSSSIKETLSQSIQDDEYMQCILTQCIEVYIAYQRGVFIHNSALAHQQSLSFDDEDDGAAGSADQTAVPSIPEAIDPRIGELVEHLVRFHVANGHHSESLGICIDALRLDLLNEVLLGAKAKLAASLMRETFLAAIHTVDLPGFKRELLNLLVRLYRTPAQADESSNGPESPVAAAPPQEKQSTRQSHGVMTELRPSSATSLYVVSDILSLCQCLQALGDATALAAVLNELIGSSTKDDHLLAYQVAFDLCQYQQIAFTSRVARLICDKETLALVEKIKSPLPSVNRASGSSTSTSPVPVIAPTNLETSSTGTAAAAASTSTSTNDSTTTTAVAVPPLNTGSDVVVTPRVNVYQILTGKASAALHSHFLYKNCQNSDDWFGQFGSYDNNRSQAISSAFYTGYSIAQSGTHHDGLLRSQWQHADGADLWSKFMNRAALGSIYRGQHQYIRDILAPFLPDASNITSNSNTNSGASYNHGGALYALGIASCGVQSDEHMEYLTEILNKAVTTKDEPLIHGASLAVGLCGIGSGDDNLYETLRGVIWEDQPVAGEGAGVATGLLMVGLGADPQKTLIVKELVAFARSCPHEKIVRGVGIALALMFFGLSHASEPVTRTLYRDPSPQLRWAAVWIDAMAYCGTGDSTVIRRLLSLAVSDTDDSIARSSAIALGFVMLHEGDQLVNLLEQLAQSYNPAVRHGVALSIGIACGGYGGMSAAYKVIEPMLTDSQDVVRQAAYIAAAMVLSQSNDTHAKEFDTKLTQLLQQRPVALVNIGALYAGGIFRAGGLNAQIRLLNQFNQQRTIAICGMMLFCQFWYWYPLALCFSLTLSPTGIIAVDETLHVPSNIKFVADVSQKKMGYLAITTTKQQFEKKKQISNKLSAASRGRKKLSTVLNRFGSFASDILHTPSLSKAVSSSIALDAKDEKGQDMKDDEEDSGVLLAGAPIDPKTGFTKEQEEKAKAKQERLEQRQREKELRLPVHVLANCSRVLPKYIDRIWCPKQRFVPVKTRLFGIVLVRDSDPSAGEFEVDSPRFPSLTPGHDIDADEPLAPQPFAIGADTMDDDDAPVSSPADEQPPTEDPATDPEATHDAPETTE